MIATKDTLTAAGEASEIAAEPPFNAQSLSRLIDTINAAPEILEGDWRRLVRTAFRLSDEQSESLVEVDPGRVEEIQAYLETAAEYIKRGGAIRGKIVKRPVEERTPEAVHEVHIELIECPAPAPSPQKMNIPRMLRIAHCDADCRNWQWNSF
jgi:hypothetical protein